MKVAILNDQLQPKGFIDIPSLEQEVNASMHAQVIQFLRTAIRESIAHTKTRGEVRGGGVKPWRQKGTGRARAGSSRSPLWRGGGVTFGPRSIQNFRTRLPKKVHGTVLRNALHEKATSNMLFVIEAFDTDIRKTKKAEVLLHKLTGTEGTYLLILDPDTKVLEKPFRNIPYVTVKRGSATALDITQANCVVITHKALELLLGSELGIEKPVKKEPKEQLESAK